jgi:ferric-dicitrate binding protein FerR (iron transport regulator)
MEIRPASCEQAAAFMSLDLDGELSRFEQAMLRRHLSGCERCAEEAGRAAALTALLRSVPLEELSVPVVVSRSGRRRLAVVQSVAAVAVVALAGSWFGLSITGRPANHAGSSKQPQVRPALAKVIAPDDRFDWQGGGPARGQRFVQFVPGGLHMSDS